ncbi:MAG: HEAT repeat domain-containing protein, partial [Planctomycetota bacterium]
MRTATILLALLMPTGLLAQEAPTFAGKSADAWANLLGLSSTDRVRAMGELADGGRAAVPVIRDLLKRGPSQRLGAMAALALMKRDGEAAEPELRTILREGDAYMRYTAATALVAIGRAGAEVVSSLVWGLEHGNERKAAVSALERLAPRSKEEAAKLIPHLESKDARVVRTAIVLLGLMGDVAADAVPALLRHLRDPRGGHRFAASEALGGIGAPAVPHLEEALDDERATVRFLAAHGLVVHGDPPVAAVRILVRTLKERRDLRRIAAADLAKLGPQAEPAIPQLVAALADED